MKEKESNAYAWNTITEPGNKKKKKTQTNNHSGQTPSTAGCVVDVSGSTAAFVATSPLLSSLPGACKVENGEGGGERRLGLVTLVYFFV